MYLPQLGIFTGTPVYYYKIFRIDMRIKNTVYNTSDFASLYPINFIENNEQ